MSKDKKNNQQPKEERKEKMSSTFKVAMITAITTLLFIAILLLLILFGMKKCQGNTQGSTSSEQPIDTETNAKINKSFLDIVAAKTVGSISAIGVSSILLFPNTGTT